MANLLIPPSGLLPFTRPWKMFHHFRSKFKTLMSPVIAADISSLERPQSEGYRTSFKFDQQDGVTRKYLKETFIRSRTSGLETFRWRVISSFPRRKLSTQ